MKKIIALLLCVCLCFSLAACSAGGPVNLVKKGELNDYPDQPIAKTFRKAFKELDMKVEKETWEDLTKEYEDELEELGDDLALVSSTYELSYDDEEQELVVNYLVDMEDESFGILSLEIDGEFIDDEDEIADILDEIFD